MSLSRRAFVGALAALAGGCQGAVARPSRTSASHASEDSTSSISVTRWASERQAKHGAFPPRCAVLLHSGWGRRWPSQERFANPDAAGVRHFPGFSRAAVELLAKSPAVLGIGTDTFSLDPGRDVRYEGHRVLSSTGKWALECLASLGRLPARGARLFVGVPKVEAASGGPARVIAWVPRLGENR